MRHRFFKRNQVGQSIIILAIGFIALVGFVGIVTDVSLLFVRYSTLRRAVDAAAVAAAGQMRRIPDPTPGDGIAEDQASSVASMNLAARTFIEYYGLNPQQVLVETCRAQNIFLDAQGRPMDNAAPRNLLYNYDSNGIRTTPNPAANAAVRRRYEELCTRDELKLVRVTAQIQSPTVFLSLLGHSTITLTETAISQTAVIDVVMVIDVSESMLNQTGYDDWESIGQGVRYLPQVLRQITHDVEIDNLINNTQASANVAYPPEAFRPGGTGSVDDVEPRSDCRVRAWPMSIYGAASIPALTSLTNPSNPLRTEYIDYLSSTGRPPITDYFPGGSRFSTFVPMYNSFACCNDPGLPGVNPDFRFDDAICQPFRDARDAAEQFLDRLDFIRGDRIAYVTFDRRAHVIDPDGTGIQTPMIETQRNLPGSADTARRGAYETLRDVVGVRAEPSFYTDGQPNTNADNDGYWDGFNNGGNRVDWNDYMNTLRIGQILDHPVNGACPLDMAAMRPPNHTLFDFMPDGTTPRTSTNPLLQDILTLPAWFSSVSSGDPLWHNYEILASCGGTNIGASLAAASNTLYQNARREGAVWIMVFLGDGAAGASNVMARSNAAAPPPSRLSNIANPYVVNGSGQYQPLAGEYGGFGLCPEGTSANPARRLTELRFPFCGDVRPQSRNFCGDAPANPDLRPIDTIPNCDLNFYDVDDYARDWADWVGLANLPGQTAGAQSGRVGDQQLPTIFAIGYGLSFERPPSPTNCSTAQECFLLGNIEDYLGEELLRYIADVGDNFRIDSDHQQFLLGPRIPNRVDVATPDWGPRGACERPITSASQRGQFMPLPITVSCGNYFNATDGAALENVFNQIAQRMFTRLSQ